MLCLYFEKVILKVPAGLLSTIHDGEPRAVLDFDEEHYGRAAGWRGSSKHGRFQAAVRLPMALHSSGWLQMQVCGFHMINDDPLQTAVRRLFP